MVRIVSVLALAVASFTFACSAPVEDDDTATSTDNLVISADADAQGCALVRAFTQDGLADVKRLKASELPNTVRPRVGSAKVTGKLTVGERDAFMIADDTTTRFFREDGILIARALKKSAKTTWTGTTGEPLKCAVTSKAETDTEKE